MQIFVKDDTDGYVVRYNGVPLVSPPTNKIYTSGNQPVAGPTITLPASTLSGASSTHIYLTVECGANATSANLTLYFASTCDPNVSQTEKLSITCVQPCPSLQWATPISAAQPLLINSANIASQSPVSHVWPCWLALRRAAAVLLALTKWLSRHGFRHGRPLLTMPTPAGIYMVCVCCTTDWRYALAPPPPACPCA